MIKAKLLNSEAELNDFFEIASISYVPGENLDIVIRLFDSQKDIRLIPTDAGATVDLTFQTKTAPNTITLAASQVNAEDKSMWKVSLTQAQTTDLAGGNIEVTYDVAGDDVTIFKAIIRNALVRTILSGDC